ncbi:MAG: EutN/CcmL family microcompartment protein [Alkalispirochaeta sp.]
MTLCDVVGTVVGTQHHPVLDGRKVLVCLPVDPRSGRRISTKEIVAVDTVQAGIGDRVLVCDEGNAARLVLGDKTAPVRTLVVAVVDQIDLSET